jgi:hypothetical protein
MAPDVPERENLLRGELKMPITIFYLIVNSARVFNLNVNRHTRRNSSIVLLATVDNCKSSRHPVAPYALIANRSMLSSLRSYTTAILLSFAST